MSMVDLHSHVLPGVDDGSPDLEVSLEMLRQSAAGGTTVLAATPHQHPGRYPNQRPVLEEAHARLVAERDRCVAAGETLPEVVLGSEVHLDAGLVERLASGELLTLGGSDCVLLELPDVFPSSAVEQALHALAVAGHRVLLAHPERNAQILRKPELLRRYLDLGALAQVTGSSVAGRFGSDCQEVALSWLDIGWVHVVASDAHDLVRRTTSLAEARAVVEDRAGPETARRLFEDCPRSLLAGTPLQLPLPGEWQPPRRGLWSRVFGRR
ncbi:MAG: CpsB/CapC family capsule biosynthesis tyrosine phosphatase [Acidobacteriota bacterium]